MGKLEYSEPYAIQETYAEDGDLVLKDGNVIWTFTREIRGEVIAVNRVIMPFARYMGLREKARRMLLLRDPTHALEIVEAPRGKPLS